MTGVIFEGVCCDDCAMFHANGETPVGMETQEEADAWVQAIVDRGAGRGVLACTDCWTDCDEFSSSQCDSCGTTLAGRRHLFAVLSD